MNNTNIHEKITNTKNKIQIHTYKCVYYKKSVALYQNSLRKHDDKSTGIM